MRFMSDLLGGRPGVVTMTQDVRIRRMVLHLTYNLGGGDNVEF